MLISSQLPSLYPPSSCILINLTRTPRRISHLSAYWQLKWKNRTALKVSNNQRTNHFQPDYDVFVDVASCWYCFSSAFFHCLSATRRGGRPSQYSWLRVPGSDQSAQHPGTRPPPQRGAATAERRRKGWSGRCRGCRPPPPRPGQWPWGTWWGPWCRYKYTSGTCSSERQRGLAGAGCEGLRVALEKENCVTTITAVTMLESHLTSSSLCPNSSAQPRGI